MREWVFPHKIGLRIGMHSCSVTCDLETNTQHTCSCEYHMPPREGEGGGEFICSQSDDVSCSKNCGARVIQTLPTFSHMLSYSQAPARSRNNSMPLVPGKSGKKLQQHIVYTAQEASASSRPLQPFPNVYSK